MYSEEDVNAMKWSVREFVGSNPNVAKYVFEKDNAVIEAVLYKYPDYRTRTVVCCSVQSGCPVGCTFCGTGNRFIKNLSANEIAMQVVYLLSVTGVDPNDMCRLQIMFMSMGEPFLNYDNVSSAISMLHWDYPEAELLVSTMGPKSDHYNDFKWRSVNIDKIGLQFSIHSPWAPERDRLIPYKDKLSLSQLARIGRQ